MANEKRNLLISCLVALRACTVAVKDVRDVERSIEVTAETLYRGDRHRPFRAAAGQLGRRDRTGIQDSERSRPSVHQPPLSMRRKSIWAILIAKTPLAGKCRSVGLFRGLLSKNCEF
jgi:hypothetical protein